MELDTIFELILLGVATGTLSGFFGIGGGTILVPMLLAFGFEMKSAVGISVIQMVFSSVYGSFLNFKKGTLKLELVLTIGFGGFVGALAAPYIVSSLSSISLEITFASFVLFALLRMGFNTKEGKSIVQPNQFILFIIGVVLGAFAISIGVGGSILLVPILVGFLGVGLKEAVSAGLFFVVFSSISGLIGLSIGGELDYKSGVVIGIASLLGVFGGIYLKDKTSNRLQKRLLMIFYIGVLTYLIYRIYGEY